MARRSSTIICPTCDREGVKKNGKLASGKIQYRCTQCGASFVKERPDIQQRSALTLLLDYLTSSKRLDELLPVSVSTIRRRLATAWTIPTPAPTVTGEIHPYLLIDGTRLAYRWMLLVARGPKYVAGWQWATSESAQAWNTLFARLVPPQVVVTDGGGGAYKAIVRAWPGVRIQRCLVHVYRNNIRDLTQNPRTEAGKALHALSQQLLQVSSIGEAIYWQFLFTMLGDTYKKHFNERTYAKDDPIQARQRGNKKWWYTHLRDRRVYYRLRGLLLNQQLFTFLEFDTPRTTNGVESINAVLKGAHRHHRGLTEEHMITAMDWLLYLRTEDPTPLNVIYHDWIADGRPHRRVIPQTPKPSQPERGKPLEIDHKIDTQAPWEDGLTLRKGNLRN